MSTVRTTCRTTRCNTADAPKDLPGSECCRARVVLSGTAMKGGGHERSRKTRTVRTRAEDLRSRGAACGQAIRLFQFLDLVVLHCPADCLRRVSRRHVQIRGGRGGGRENRSGGRRAAGGERPSAGE